MLCIIIEGFFIIFLNRFLSFIHRAKDVSLELDINGLDLSWTDAY